MNIIFSNCLLHTKLLGLLFFTAQEVRILRSILAYQFFLHPPLYYLLDLGADCLSAEGFLAVATTVMRTFSNR